MLTLCDHDLLARMRAEADGESLGEFARNAVRRFAAEAKTKNGSV